MTLKVETITGVAYWASYLVNGDATGMEDSEIALCDKWCDSIAPYYVISVEDDSERFTWSGHLYGSDCAGVTVCDYICHSVE